MSHSVNLYFFLNYQQKYKKSKTLSMHSMVSRRWGRYNIAKFNKIMKEEEMQLCNADLKKSLELDDGLISISC
jgi:transcriptional antiterminator